jgi:hypothetical protein
MKRAAPLEDNVLASLIKKLTNVESFALKPYYKFKLFHGTYSFTTLALFTALKRLRYFELLPMKPNNYPHLLSLLTQLTAIKVYTFAPPIQAAIKMTNIKYLDLQMCPVSDVEYKLLSCATQLRVLKLTRVKPRIEDTLHYFTNLTLLEWLKIGFADTNDSQFHHISKLTNLKQLSLFYVDKIHSQSLGYITDFKNLVSLNINDCRGFDNTATLFLKTLTSLQVLKCLSTLLEDSNIAEIVMNLRNLSRLWLPKQTSTRTLEALCTLPQLYELLLEGSSSTVPQQIQYIPQLTVLSSLSVEYPIINSKIISAIVSLTNLKSLSIVEIVTPQDDMGNVYLNELTVLSSLRKLKLKSIHLVDADYNFLLKFSCLTSLELLNMKNITVENVLLLTKLSTLNRLFVYDKYDVPPDTTFNKYFPFLEAHILLDKKYKKDNFLV